MGFLGALLGAAAPVAAGMASGRRQGEQTRYDREQAELAKAAERQAVQRQMEEFQARQAMADAQNRSTEQYRQQSLRQAADLAERERIRREARDIVDKDRYDADRADRDKQHDAQIKLGYARLNADQTPKAPSFQKIPVNVQKNIMEGASAVQNLDYVLQQFDAAAAKHGGDPKKIPGFGVTNALGGASVKNWAGISTEEERNLRRFAANAGSMVIKDRSGANVTAKEFPRLASFVPSIWDPPEKILEDLREFRRVAKEELDLYQATFSEDNGYHSLKVPGTREAAPEQPGGQGPTPDAAARAAATLRAYEARRNRTPRGATGEF